MNFVESISNYVLGNFTDKDLPRIAEIALVENLESESIYILAGMNSKDNSFEIVQYFEKSLCELEIKLPTREQAAKNLVKFYLRKISEKPDEAFEIMADLDKEVYMKVYVQGEKMYLGEELKIEKLYTWYREIQDWNDEGILFYHNDLSRDDQRIKFQENLIAEAKEALKNNYT